MRSSKTFTASLAIRIGPTGIGVVAVEGIKATPAIPAFRGGIADSADEIIVSDVLIKVTIEFTPF